MVKVKGDLTKDVAKVVILAPNSQEETCSILSVDVGQPLSIPCTFVAVAKPISRFLPLPQQTTLPSLAAPFYVCAVLSKENVLSVDWEHVGGGKDKTYNVYLQKRYADSSWQKSNHSPLTLKEYTHFNSVYKDSEYSVSVITISGNVESDYTENNFCGNFSEDNRAGSNYS